MKSSSFNNHGYNTYITISYLLSVVFYIIDRQTPTSSAGPIVASAVIAVQSWYKANHNGEVLSPHAMRDLLIETGTRQGSGGHIGPLPNIRRAIEALQSNGDNAVRWSPNSVRYEVDDLVEYNGGKYICTQAHVSNSGWAPGVANTLWKLVGQVI